MENTGSFFDLIYTRAQHNSIILIDTDGIMLECNEAFTKSYGYTTNDIRSKNFEMLFTPHDRLMGKPINELMSTLRDGHCNDDNYLVAKNGNFIWATGESLRVDPPGGKTLVVKLIHDIDSQKQLERFLLESDSFLENMFESAKNVALMTLDGNMKISAGQMSIFLNFLIWTTMPKEGSRLSDLDHPFWNDAAIKTVIRDSIVQEKARCAMDGLVITTQKGKTWNVSLKSKLIDHLSEKRLLVVIQEESS